MFLIKVFAKLFRIIVFIKDRALYTCLSDSAIPCINWIHKKIAEVYLKNRKLVGFYGECHMYIYDNTVAKNREFKKKYVALGTKEIEYLAKYHRKQINRKEIWNKLDVLIYNDGIPNRKDAPSLSTVLEWVKPEAQKINVTNAVFTGYFPQHTDKVFKNNGYFAWGDKNLNKILNGAENASFLKDIQKDDFYSSDYVNKFFDKAIKFLNLYEKDCDIKIADYIELFGRDRVLFYSVTHPENEIMLEISRRILNTLGIKIDQTQLKNTSTGLFDLHSHGEVVYPSVHKGLNIKEPWGTRKIKPGDYNVSYTFEEYINEYMKIGEIGINE